MPSGKVTCRQRDILLTRFPFSDLVGSKVRPVLVLSNDAYNRRFSDVLICAITSSPRPHEYAVDLAAKDLEQGIILKKIGRVKKEKYREAVNLVQKLIDGR